VKDEAELSHEDPCPNCENRTLTERGVTVRYNDGSEARASHLGCLNCDWSNRGESA